jgi:hypothetical protein
MALHYGIALWRHRFQDLLGKTVEIVSERMDRHKVVFVRYLAFQMRARSQEPACLSCA